MSAPEQTTMLALQQQSSNTSDLTLGPLPIPRPPDNHVLIRVHAAALNPVDFKRTNSDNFPVVVGYDVAGVVHAVGHHVTKWQGGDRVFGDILTDTLGPKTTGSIAEYCVSPTDVLARIPDSISYTDAAAVPLVIQTALMALRAVACKPGHRVFISGGSGGFGIHAIQVAKAVFGASQVATTASGPKHDTVKSYGADIVVDYRQKDAGDVLKDWADVAIDCTTETDMVKRILKPGGDMVSIAEFSKPDVNVVLIQPSKEMMTEVAAMLANGSLKPVVDSVYPLPRWEEAIQHQKKGHPTGKVVFQVA